MALSLFFVLCINFFIFRMLPGDPVRIMFRDPRVTPEMRQTLTEEFGLNKPLPEQFFIYITQTLRGNLGTSFRYRAPVMQIVIPLFMNTLLLVIPMMVLTTLIGVMIGVLSAWRHGTKIDLSLSVFSLVTWAMPTFWLALVMIVYFSLYLGLFPTSGMVTVGAVYSSPWDSIVDYLKHLFLPLVTMSVLWLGQFAIIMRNSMVDVLTEDYMLTAKAKGLSTFRILWSHAIRNSILPVVTLTALNIGYVVSGDIQIETVFSWPGIGRLVFDAISHRDYPILQGCCIIFSVVMILANFFADITYSYLDPRVKD